MDKRLHHLITHNFWLKVLSLLAAALFWLIVVSIEDPSQTRSFTTTVQAENEDVITDAGKYWSFRDGKNTVTFRVSARRSIIEKLNGSDFNVIADMKNLEEDYRVPVDISVTRYMGAVSIAPQTYYAYVDVGDEKTTNFVITAGAVGDPADGFVLDKVSVSPNVVEVSGPEEDVSSIKKVVVVCDITGMSEDITEKAVPRYLGKNGKEVDTKKLSFNVDAVDVSVTMVSSKRVPIEVETSGELPEDVKLESIKTSPSKLSIRGPAEILNDMTSIEIPPSVIDLSTITKDIETEVDITQYLPEGVSLVSTDKSKVTIQVDVGKVTSKRIKIRTKNLTIRNLGDELGAKFKDKTVAVDIVGNESDLESLDEDSITGSVDVSGLSEGTHSVAVDLVLDDEFAAQTATTDIVIKHNKQGE